MIGQTGFRYIHSSCMGPPRALMTAVCCSALVLISAFAFYPERLGHAANHKRQQLTFEDRVEAQRAIEAVYWRRRLWPTENPQPKPPLDQVMPDEALRAKVEDYLRKSTALEVHWQRAITADQLQAEMERMARETKQPEVLGELWAALGNDPLLVAECLARPLLADRLLRERYAADERFHGESRRRAEAELNWPDAAHRLREMSGEYREVEWRLDEDAARPEVTARDGVVALQPAEWRARMEQLRRMFDSAPDGAQSTAFRRKGLVNETPPPEGGTLNAISPRLLPLGQVSALQEDEERRYAAAVLEQSARRVKVAVVEWRKTPFDEWWGRVKAEMAMDATAASGEYRLTEIEAQPSSCLTDKWTATSTTGAPGHRTNHTAVWTGTEMIIWGGLIGFTGRYNTGGRYNPATDTWAFTSTTGVPAGRYDHTAVWIGSEMIVWGGFGGSGDDPTTGGRYNPATDTWTATSTTGAPASRAYHTAVWTGSVMIVWGGSNLNTGGQYNPTTNAWTATSTTGAPAGRRNHTAVWTGSEMIVWGGTNDTTGGRYNPINNSWATTSTANAPSSRGGHTVVWTGSEMIGWGGYDYGSGRGVNTGGRYNPTTNTWIATNTTNAPSARGDHTAVWTESEMIVWGNLDSNSGGRYNPASDTWTATSTANAPSRRRDHTAVWTGSAMIVWGGQVDSASGYVQLNTGGVYFPSTSALTLSPTSQSFPASGGSGSINVTAPGSCSWTASSNANWLTITSGSSGAGNGTVNYAVAANTSGSARTGTLPIGPQTFTVTQAADNPAPTLASLSPSGIAAGSVAFTLTVTGTNFINASVVRWNGSDRSTTFVSNTQLTATITAADVVAAGTASVTVFNPAPGGGASNALSFTIVNCAYAIAPTSQSFNPFGGAGSVSVTAGNVCNWTAASNANWITITSGGSGAGNGTVNYTVAANPSANSRSDALTIAGQTFTVNQSGVAQANDVGVAGFELPGTVSVNAPTTIRVRVTNFGSNPQSNFPISYQVGNQAPVTETFTDTLAPLQTATKAFTAAWTPTEPGPYQITARTNLNGDGDATNDSAQTTVQALRAQYRGSWQGTTDQNLPIRFTVNDQDVVVSLEVDVRISFPTVTCVYTLRASGTPSITNGQFNVTVNGSPSFTVLPVVRGTFTSPTSCAGRVESSSISGAICGGNLIFGNMSISEKTWSSQRQVQCHAVSSINPSGGTVGANVTITGTNLTDVTAVKFANNVTANFTFVSDTQITARVPAGAATGPITLSKAGCADVQTTAFTVQPSPTPTLTSLNPLSATAGGAAFTLTATGSNFINGSVVRWNGADRTTTFISNTQLTAAIPATDIAAAGAASVTVFNPAPGGGVSNVMSFTVNSALANVSAASFLGAELAPESIVAAFGTGLATQTVVATDTDPNTPGIQLPTELAGTTVEVKDSAGTTRRAPLFFVSPTQVNYLMPSLTAPGACVVTIKSGDGKIAAGTVQAASVAPGLFTASASGQGVAAGIVLRVRANGEQVFEPIAEFDPAQNKFVSRPIDLGPEGDQVFLILYGGGFRFRSALSTVSVKIGGPDMEVLYAAEAPGFIGLDQLNVRLARSLMGRGEVDVMLTVNGKTANTVKVAIK